MYLCNAKCTIECTFFLLTIHQCLYTLLNVQFIRRLGDNVLANMRRVTSVIPRQEAFIVSQKTFCYSPLGQKTKDHMCMDLKMCK